MRSPPRTLRILASALMLCLAVPSFALADDTPDVLTITALSDTDTAVFVTADVLVTADALESPTLAPDMISSASSLTPDADTPPDTANTPLDTADTPLDTADLSPAVVNQRVTTPYLLRCRTLTYYRGDITRVSQYSQFLRYYLGAGLSRPVILRI